MKTKRPAYSLLELLVASAIFAGIILVATSTLSAVAGFRGQEQSTSEVTNYAQSLMRQISLQVAQATSVTLNTDSSQPDNYLVISMPAIDQYGRSLGGSSGPIGYCAENGGLHIASNTTLLPASSATILSRIGCSATDTQATAQGRSVSLNATQVTPNAVRISLTVQGTIGGDGAGGRAVANPVSYTDTQIVEYNGSAASLESVK